jgi:hypothetical protein
MTALRYGHARATWAGSYRDEIPSREREPYQRPERFIGRVLVVLPFFDLDLTLQQDMRDMRRFRAVDLDGVEHAHAAPRELMRHLATLVPVYGGQR